MLTPHKYPTGRADFESIINEGFLYVDKTERMYEMIGSRKFVFLSRPRRFGKSLLVNSLSQQPLVWHGDIVIHNRPPQTPQRRHYETRA